MRYRHLLLTLGLGLPLAGAARAQSACDPAALATAARSVITTRHDLHTVAVGEYDPRVPAAVSAQLITLKTALASAADAVFACATVDATPETLQSKLADPLHANRSNRAESVIVTQNKRDLGAYGSDLDVQVIPVSNAPKYFEVVFRYGVECGDDNLLMVFGGGGDAGPGWHELLRWGSPAYTTTRDAFGDFILLTPLSGFQGGRNWRFVVAHGQPSCGAADAPSHFDLDVLQPSGDPTQPRIIWHTEQPYRRNAVPSLSSTEDTLTLELSPPDTSGKKQKVPGTPDTFSYRVSKDNVVTPVSAANAASPLGPGTSSPQ